jgi:hypothetical protein
VTERKRLPLTLAYVAAALGLPLAYVNLGPGGFFVCLRGVLNGSEPRGLSACLDVRLKVLLALVFAVAVVVAGVALHRRSSQLDPARYRFAMMAYCWLGLAPLAIVSLYTLAVMVLLYEKLH